MAKPSLKTYQRLMKKVVREMALMKPGSNAARVALLNKKFKKYDDRIKEYAAKK